MSRLISFCKGSLLAGACLLATAVPGHAQGMAADHAMPADHAMAADHAMPTDHAMPMDQGMPASPAPGDGAGGNELMRVPLAVQLPHLTLVRDDGKSVSLEKELDDGRPVFMNFIYTTCAGICPVMSQTFSLFQTKLGADRDKVHLVSISIDPEEDTPPRLREYARQFDAGPEWSHYTGTVEASVAAQRAFGVYNGDKMRHNPVTLVRAAPGKPWVRLEGFATAADLLKEFRSLVAGR